MSKFTRVILCCFILTPILAISSAATVSYSGTTIEHRSSENSYSRSPNLAFDGSNTTSALIVIRACNDSNCTQTSYYDRDYTLSTSSPANQLRFEWNIQAYDTFTPQNSVTNISFFNHLSSSWDLKKSVTGSISGWELVSINFSSDYIQGNGEIDIRLGGYHNDVSDYSDELGIWVREFHLHQISNSPLDSDADGVSDESDDCPNGETGWISNSTTDNDNDGCLDSTEDPDDDNDGYYDENDSFPYNSLEWSDFDFDGIGDNSDLDDDNDGYNDTNDSFPYNSNEWFDLDLDGIGDNSDLDDDNDGVEDTIDLFPQDSTESLDFDLDGVGDNSDLDDDNDEYADLDEISAGSNPLDSTDTPPDFDQDRSPDLIDMDDDNDGLDDDVDQCNRYNLSNWGERESDRTYSHRIEFDRDVDGCHDVAEDSDTDQDNRTDSQDDCRDSNSSMHWDSTDSNLDRDEDGCRDNVEDFDLDNDGVLDISDDFPFDECATLDTDYDGFPDYIISSDCDTQLTQDDDDDNDGVLDGNDDFPLDECASVDTDNDGKPDSKISGCQSNLLLDDDDDNDGVLDGNDDFPLDKCAATDTDSDGKPDDINDSCTTSLDEDNDDDDDGFTDSIEDNCNTDPLNSDDKPKNEQCEGECDAKIPLLAPCESRIEQQILALFALIGVLSYLNSLYKKNEKTE